jgi:hypothetical protein
MAKLIRKISIGKDYKNDAMHYAVGQEVYGGHTICDILEEEDKFLYILRRIMTYYLGKTLIRTWQYLWNIISNTNEKRSQLRSDAKRR